MSKPSEISVEIQESEDSDSDSPKLNPHTLAALKEFLEEQQQQHSMEGIEDEKEVKLVTEDWRLSQFWYDKDTAETVCEEIRYLSGLNDFSVACIACPTIYAYLKKDHPMITVHLLEFDRRFGQYGNDFTFYDYNQPEELPLELRHTFQIVVADPPYLSKECLEKVAMTISFLAHPKNSHILLLTGEVQTNRAEELLGLLPCGFRPQHSNKLGNEFRLFTNYDPEDRLGGWEKASSY